MEKIKPTINQRLDPFDFDFWRQLAEKDPESFEKHRAQLIHSVIESSPAFLHKRLRGLQWRIDMEIRRSKNAMDSCLRINRMMMDSVYEKNGLLESIRNLMDHTGHRRSEPLAYADVIPIRRKS